MNAFCTYCSASKNPQAGSIPAIERYDSTRIRKVYNAATELGIEFFDLSGEYGLLRPQHPIPLPLYDHLLKSEEVDRLVDKITEQIHECSLTGIVYFTKPLASDGRLLPYHDALATACGRATIPFTVVEIVSL